MRILHRYNIASTPIECAPYGLLYNWLTIENINNIAPSGFRVATLDDIVNLIEYLGGEDIAGGKLKESGTDNWTTPNTGATDEVGFTALPSGTRSELGIFASILFKNNIWINNK